MPWVPVIGIDVSMADVASGPIGVVAVGADGSVLAGRDGSLLPVLAATDTVTEEDRQLSVDAAIDDAEVDTADPSVDPTLDPLDGVRADLELAHPAATRPRAWATASALFVGRGDGLWRSEDAITWTRIAPVAPTALVDCDGLKTSADLVAVDVTGLACDDGHLWASTGHGAWRDGELVSTESADDVAIVDGVAWTTGDVTHSVGSTEDGPSGEGVIAWDGKVLVAGDAVWLGPPWRPIGDLPSPAHGVAIVDGAPWAATDAGLYRFDDTAPVDASILIDQALRHAALADRPSPIRAPLPELVVQAWGQPGDKVSYLESRGTLRDETGQWGIDLRVVFTPRRRSSQAWLLGPDAILDEDGRATVTARLDRRARTTAEGIALEVGSLAAGLAAVHRASPADLPARIDNELRRQELTARLTALTSR